MMAYFVYNLQFIETVGEQFWQPNYKQLEIIMTFEVIIYAILTQNTWLDS